jgi:hypothetical protein
MKPTDPNGWILNPDYEVGFDPIPPYSPALVWWQDADGREWQARIRDRVIAATTLRADGDAHPYG